jgi:hypothetical protein
MRIPDELLHCGSSGTIRRARVLRGRRGSGRVTPEVSTLSSPAWRSGERALQGRKAAHRHVLRWYASSTPQVLRRPAGPPAGPGASAHLHDHANVARSGDWCSRTRPHAWRDIGPVEHAPRIMRPQSRIPAPPARATRGRTGSSRRDQARGAAARMTRTPRAQASLGMSRTDLGLILSAFSALAVVVGAGAALVIVAFFVGVLIGRRQEQRRSSRQRGNRRG